MHREFGGLCYLVSLHLLSTPIWSAVAILAGRSLVGAAESLIITGGLLWGLGLAPPEHSAKIIAWIGMSMFAALAVGAPLGSIIFAHAGFFGIALVTTATPLVAFALIARLRPLAPRPKSGGNLWTVLRAVLLPGLGFALSGVTFASMTAFLPLYFAVQGWAHGALAFTAFAMALIASRIIFGDLPDRFGGAHVESGASGFRRRVL